MVTTCKMAQSLMNYSNLDEIHRIVGESELEYEVTASMKLWLPKALVDPKLVKKYRVE